MSNLQNILLIIRLARPHFLILGFLLYSLGYMIALTSNSQFDLSKFLLGYLIFGFAHLSVSFSNDFYDRFSDRATKKTFFSGGSKVLVEHPELESLALKIAVTLLVLSALGFFAFTFIYKYDYTFFLFGVMGGLLGWFYSAPPLQFSYRGLGEVVTTLTVGFFMPGMGYFVASGIIALNFIVFVLPLSLYGLFFIISVELPDLEADKLANRKNLVVLLGRRNATIISILSTITATLSIIILEPLNLFARISLLPILVFSFIPFIAAVLSYIRKNAVMLNVFSMVIFIVALNLYFLTQI